eukprot:2517887-Rhodomonas_salina.1
MGVFAFSSASFEATTVVASLVTLFGWLASVSLSPPITPSTASTSRAWIFASSSNTQFSADSQFPSRTESRKRCSEASWGSRVCN